VTDRRYFVVGDIHGCYPKLKKLLTRLDWTPDGDDLLVFLGDYIDRGPQSYEVVDTLADLAGRSSNLVTLMGNHEEMFLRFVGGGFRPPFHDNGFSATVRNYADRRLTVEHFRFLRGLIPFYEAEGHIFVHAGLQPGLPLPSQSLYDMLWIRDEFLRSDHDFGRLVVFGHTPFKRPFQAPGRLGLDTGAVYGGPLTCAVLPGPRFITAD
jgi:serine/threonine protein phosphatase 1